MITNPLKHLPVRARVFAALALALSVAALVALPLARPAQAHAADPMTLTVTRSDDADERGTLRWALNKVNAGEGTRIEFDTTVLGASPVIELQSELPTIVSAVEIAGPAGGVTIKKASTAGMPGGWRHLNIFKGAQEFNVSISNVTFQGPGTVDVSPEVENGGIYVDSYFVGTLELTGCTLKDNYNDQGNAARPQTISRGGAINVLSTTAELWMTDCTVEGNTAYSYGGGVYSVSPLFAEDCSFSGNVSKSDSAGGGAFLCTGQTELTRCVVDRNHSDGDSGGVQAETLTMTGCTVTNNTAGASGTSSTGGGVASDNLVMTDCEVRDNSSTGQGGGIYAPVSATITGSIVSGNASEDVGGGVFIALEGVVQSSKIVGNTSAKMGAGVAAGDGDTDVTESTLKLVDSTIEGNTSKGAGGGIFVYDMCALTLTNTTVSNNEAKLSGGGIHGQKTSSLSMTGGQITGNKTSDTEGHGGGVFLENGTAVLERCPVSNNTAAESGGGLFVSSLTARDVQLSRNVAGTEGGGVFAAFLEASGCMFDGNTAKAGGALKTPDAALTNCTVFGNTASGEGGGVAGLTTKLTNCTVSGNVGASGSGVLADALTMNGSIVAGNYDADGKPNELAVGSTTDNGDGTVSDSFGKKNIVGVPADGLGTVLKTQKDTSGREVAVLEDNGGLTPTIMITPDGPAQDVVKGDYTVPSDDQRGIARPTGPASDIGAVEVSGLNQTYSVEQNFDVYRGGDQSLVGKVVAPLRSALGVQVGGTTLEAGKHYALSEGSTVITLLPAYLKTLKDGTYDVVVSFTNGSATLPLQVELPKPDPDPVTPTVTKAGDTPDEEGTLRWALDKVNAGEATRIEFDPKAMGSSVIEIQSELPAIEGAVEIVGPAGGIIIKKDPNVNLPAGWRHLRIKGAGFDVSISNVIFEGPGAQGAVPKVENGGIFVDSGFSGTLALTGCTLRDNCNNHGNAVGATHVARGGAINVLSKNATLRMTDCKVQGNTAYSYGGGVAADNLVMTDCEVKGNTSTGMGAGIYAPVSATITGSTVSGNASEGIGGGAFIGRTGVVQSSEIVDNTSKGEGAGVAVGDGSDEHKESTLEVASSTIKGNKSLKGGGGVFAYDNCVLTLTDATVSQNEAALSGGGVYGTGTSSLNMAGGQITGNKTSASDASGGGVFLESGDAVLERCLVAENTAAGIGGGLFVNKLTARDVQLSRNVAGTEGGGVFAASLEASGCMFDGNTAKAGGALLAPDAALTNCTVFGNTAQNEGGGVAGTRVELTNCTVSGNVCGAVAAPMIAGGGVLANKLTMNGSIVAGNYDVDGKPNELAVGSTADNGTGFVADSYGKKNIIGVSASGLGTILETQKNASGREVAVLKDNGGPTPTIMITPDGPAQDIVKGDYIAPKTDQRGIARPAGPASDIGAVEVSDLKLTYDDVETFDVYRGGDESLIGKVAAPLRSVLGVQMDGTTLEAGKHYTLAKGSTVITLMPAYLKTLKDGTYDVVVSFTNGSATLPLQVELPKPDPVDPPEPDPPVVDPPTPVTPVEPVKPLEPAEPVEPVKQATIPPTGDATGPFAATLVLAAVAAVALGIARRRLG